MVASNLLDLGYGIAEVAERLGHDPATLMRYYARVNARRRRQAADDLAGLITPDLNALAERGTQHEDDHPASSARRSRMQCGRSNTNGT